MVVSEITLSNTLKAKLGEQEAQIIVEGIKTSVKEEFDNKRASLSTKEDISNLHIELKETKSEMIKWMFIFWIGSVGVLSGIMFAMLNAYLK